MEMGEEVKRGERREGVGEKGRRGKRRSEERWVKGRREGKRERRKE